MLVDKIVDQIREWNFRCTESLFLEPLYPRQQNGLAFTVLYLTGIGNFFSTHNLIKIREKK
jgi:hypothetical protein